MGEPRRSARPEWLEEGAEPDYRFTLANERTFLAWVRTTLALVAAAVAVVQLVPPFGVPGADVALGVALSLTALGTAVLSYTRWRENERAIRRGAPLPHSRGLVLLATALAGVVGVVTALLVAG